MNDEPYPPPPFAPPPPPSAPPPGPPPGGPGASPIPWEERARLGFGKALVDNVKLFVTAPQEGFRRMLEKGDYASPILFAILVGWVGVAFVYFWNFLFGSSMMFLPGMREEMGAILAMQGAISVGLLVIAPIFICLGLFIGAGIFHLCLLLVKGTEQSSAGFEGTVRVLAYSSVGQLAQIVPFVGGLISLVWVLILYVLGLSAVHRTTQGKAALAVLIPFILCCVCLAVAVAVGIGGLLAGSGGLSPENLGVR